MPDLVLGEVVHRGAEAVARRARHRRTGRALIVKQTVAGHGLPHDSVPGPGPLLQVDHPGVLVPQDQDGDGNVVLPEVTGGTLAELVAARCPLGEKAVTQLVLGITDALDHLHRRGLVHGDLSATNVLLHPDGQPVLADARPPTAIATDRRDQTGPLGSTAGTAGYAPPEVVDGVTPDPRADIFSVGVLGLECLGPSGSPKLRAALARAAHPDPARRPATARALAAAVVDAVPDTSWLDRVPAGTPSERSRPPDRPPATRAFGPPPPRPAPPAGAPGSRGRILRPLAAVVGVLVATGTLLVAAHHGGAPPCPALPDSADSLLRGDLDGDGCDQAVAFDGTAAVAVLPDGRRLQVGEPDDVMLLGDWDCDGVDTPALYRPATGEVFEFATWVSDGSTLMSSDTHHTGIRHGTPKVAEPTGAGCERVAVVPSEG